MNWIAMVFAVEVGWASAPSWLTEVQTPEFQNEVTQVAPDTTWYTGLEVGLLISDLILVEGAVTTYSGNATGKPYPTFAPFLAEYWFGFGMQHRGFSAGWRHLCLHPILSSQRPEVGYLWGGGDVLYARYEGKIE